MKRVLYLTSLSIFILCPLFFCYSLEEDIQIARRVQAHLIIKDFKSAQNEARIALNQYPKSSSLHEIYIKSLARVGDEKEMLRAWNDYIKIFPEKKTSRELIEEMCWGVINKGSTSSSMPTRIIAMLAGFFSQDFRGIQILQQGMRDSNSVVRAAAVELAAHLHDYKLIEEIKVLFRTERLWHVRKEVLKAIGKMKIKEMLPELESLVASESSSAEEKALAIKSLIELLDDIKQEEVIRLANSNRAGLRLLACQAVAHFRLERDVDQLIYLAQDHNSSVRFSAIQALGLVRLHKNSQAIINIARSKIRDKDYKVGIAASWLLALYIPKEGESALEYYLNQRKQEIRLLAAAAINATGKYGVNLATYYLMNHPDPYIQLNLALGAIGQRVYTTSAAETIYRIFNVEKDKWDNLEEGIFQAIVPRNINKLAVSDLDEEDAATPELDNQIVRLEILNSLAIINSAQAQEAARKFLMERTWGISGTAAAFLLMEGNETANDYVQGLLQDSQDRVRTQAALILSLWGREEKTIGVLEQSYKTADRELKGRILEGIGRIGSMTSVPFLIEVLQEPSQHLRIIAAMALIQCLNH